ncbi:hypothetical protein CCZ01_06890 [Helicobacter monodelphidis]|uniref:YdcH family protein n=1 Tax=Helicobacter sp. 15-1451 TaxID=2004995 RepID=UPI000DCCFF6A|nr:YdcH family protein [Helicobacter sp. 15-1451]RAX57184.1 hypothetical protein CCZ01_06890 [Helicobacter sp. 15-1451]
MLHEYRDEISELKQKDAHFAKIFDEHNDLDQQIKDAEEGRTPMDSYALETLKKKKLALKDEAYSMVREFIKERDSKK